ncbi:unnamed protein product [Coffea canephora]|uniref:Thioredoxin domain-containing protein n=1 Tax=Coffea canephora TaxID=49390 RepID=A0A068VBX9_COFCA|nr:unnamed protein product [Coffea canephora]
MKGIPTILRRLAASRPSSIAARFSSSSSLTETLVLSSAAATLSYSTFVLSDDKRRPLFNSVVTPAISPNLPSTIPRNNSRSFSSDSSSGRSKIVSIESEEQLNDSLRKAQDESLPALFYFTAAWCGPCKFISPVIGQLSEKYPHVTTYKIDIDKDALAAALMKLGIHSVPTIHFFQNGKKASEMVGADVKQLNATMEELYK